MGTEKVDHACTILRMALRLVIASFSCVDSMQNESDAFRVARNATTFPPDAST